MNEELAEYLAELAERDPDKANALSRLALEREKEMRFGTWIRSPFAIFLMILLGVTSAGAGLCLIDSGQTQAMSIARVALTLLAIAAGFCWLFSEPRR
ncbi:TPA: hypothetical protein SL557_000353 [Pseudomonas aeruginosa]|nr:hypothetical protein [Pseudomonas aeruginosa]